MIKKRHDNFNSNTITFNTIDVFTHIKGNINSIKSNIPGKYETFFNID